jgi:hypothetical protein
VYVTIGVRVCRELIDDVLEAVFDAVPLNDPVWLDERRPVHVPEEVAELLRDSRAERECCAVVVELVDTLELTVVLGETPVVGVLRDDALEDLEPVVVFEIEDVLVPVFELVEVRVALVDDVDVLDTVVVLDSAALAVDVLLPDDDLETVSELYNETVGCADRVDVRVGAPVCDGITFPAAKNRGCITVCDSSYLVLSLSLSLSLSPSPNPTWSKSRQKKPARSIILLV